MAARTLTDAPFERFALVGHSMGGYVALEIMRQAPERIERLALLDTQARPDTAEAIERRKALIELAQQGRMDAVAERLVPVVFDSVEVVDAALIAIHRDMVRSVGAEARITSYNVCYTKLLREIENTSSTGIRNAPSIARSGVGM